MKRTCATLLLVFALCVALPGAALAHRAPTRAEVASITKIELTGFKDSGTPCTIRRVHIVVSTVPGARWALATLIPTKSTAQYCGNGSEVLKGGVHGWRQVFSTSSTPACGDLATAVAIDLFGECLIDLDGTEGYDEALQAKIDAYYDSLNTWTTYGGVIATNCEKKNPKDLARITCEAYVDVTTSGGCNEDDVYAHFTDGTQDAVIDEDDTCSDDAPGSQ